MSDIHTLILFNDIKFSWGRQTGSQVDASQRKELLEAARIKTKLLLLESQTVRYRDGAIQKIKIHSPNDRSNALHHPDPLVLP